jgi:hypothetical protein
MARGTILGRSSYCLCLAVELERWPADRRFDEAEAARLAEEWATQRFTTGRASSTRWPKAHFRFAAADFLQSMGRLRSPPVAEPGRYDAELDEFIAAQHQGRWLSKATCRSAIMVPRSYIR